MNTSRFDVLFAAVSISMIAGTAFGGWLVSRDADARLEAFKTEAAKRGFAAWIVNGDHQAEWRWNEPYDPVEERFRREHDGLSKKEYEEVRRSTEEFMKDLDRAMERSREEYEADERQKEKDKKSLGAGS